MPLSQSGRFWRTVRHLRAQQVLWRAWFRLHKPRPDLRPAPPLRARSGAWATPARREPSIVGPQRFCFLNVEHTLGPTPGAWDDPAQERLWRYNLHYFDDLNAAGHTQRTAAHRELVARWIAENPPGCGTGWEPYPASLRIANWIKWFLGGAPVQAPWLDSLAAQARWLRDRLEWHLLGNHLFVNAKALVFAGLFFEGPEADSWLATGLAILRRELPEQILADGGQFERTPMYHALALEDLLDLLNGIAACAPAHSPAQALVLDLRHRSSAMLHWLRCLRHPDGALARLNDTAEGIAPPTSDLERYAAALGITAPTPPNEGLLALQPSGYVRVQRGAAVAFIDVAPIGPDYLPGHAHADTLSFELSVNGQQLIVNRGTSVYGTGPRRQWERGTAAHSTVQIGAHDSSEVWAGFRVGRRARPLAVRVEADAVDAAHDGYRHLPGGPVHRRRWQFEDGALMVQDWVTPTPTEVATAHWHFAPGLHLVDEGDQTWLVVEGERALARLKVVAGQAQLASTLHATRFGQLVDALTLKVRLVEGQAAARFTWNV